MTYGTKTYDWTLAAADSPSLLMPIPGTMGKGEISDHDLCPFWDEDNQGKPLKATLVHVDPEIRPLITVMDRKRIPRIQDKILTNIPTAPVGEDQLPLKPLVPSPPYVFEFTTNIEPGQTKITLEGSDAVFRIYDIKFYAQLPAADLLAGKDVSQEYPYRHNQVGNPGTLTVRFIPAKKRP